MSAEITLANERSGLHKIINPLGFHFILKNTEGLPDTAWRTDNVPFYYRRGKYSGSEDYWLEVYVSDGIKEFSDEQIRVAMYEAISGMKTGDKFSYGYGLMSLEDDERCDRIKREALELYFPHP